LIDQNDAEIRVQGYLEPIRLRPIGRDPGCDTYCNRRTADPGQDLRARAKGDALPEGGFAGLKKTGTRHGMDYKLRVRDDYGMGASRTGAGSAYGREGGSVVGRGAAPGGVVPDELDGAA